MATDKSVQAATPRGALARARAFGAVALASVALAGCVERDMTDLQRYVEEVLARQAPVIAPLPQVRPYEIYAYQSAGKKDPFEPFFGNRGNDRPETTQTPCPGPDPDRVREELEAYPLDSLRMVGTIERDEVLWGVVLSAEGAIHRVTVENFMGRNNGRIVDIREEAIDIIEIVPDGQGCWQERDTTLALIE